MILVTGATGTVGRSLCRRLAASKLPARGLTRDAAKAVELRAIGVEAAVADPAHPATLPPAFAGVTKLFLLGTGAAGQAEQELALLEAARQARVSRVVKLSAWGAETEAFTFAKIHRKVERALEGSASSLEWTILRPNGFMQNVANFFAASIRAVSAFHLPAADAVISHVDVRDIADVAAAILADEGSGHAGKAYDLSGPEGLPYGRIADMVSGAVGRPVTYIPLSDGDYRKGAVEHGLPAAYADAMVELFRFYRTGAAARVSPDVEKIAGKPARPFAAFAKESAAAFG